MKYACEVIATGSDIMTLGSLRTNVPYAMGAQE